MNSLQTIKKQYDESIMHNFSRMEAAIVRGSGSTCYDSEGKSYIDFGAGIGVCSLGHAHPEWLKAVTEQAGILSHISNLYYTLPPVELAELLCAHTSMDRVIYTNSGAESNEAAIKIARKRSFDKYGPGRHNIITLRDSFHGRTITTLSATGQEEFHNYFFPFTEGFRYAPANDVEALEGMIDDTVCGVMIETIQGEGGVKPLDAGFIRAVESLCAEHDLAFMVDEVQTGIGRTGKLLSFEHFGVQPDIVSLAKGLGNGLPIGAVLTRGEYSEVLHPGDHGSTFAGNPTICAGGCVVIRTLTAPGTLERITEKGNEIMAKLRAHPAIREVRGLGLMIGADLVKNNVGEVVKKSLERGLLILSAHAALRLLPPLTTTDAEFDQGLSVLFSVLDEEAGL